MSLFLARICLEIWHPQVSYCKRAQALFLSLSQNSDGKMDATWGSDSKKFACVHV